MSTEAQLAANRENAQLSSGPNTARGKAISCLNRLYHGFTGAFRLMDGEDPDEFACLTGHFLAEHNPSTPTERALLERMVQHFWLSKRAINLQATCTDDHKLALYLRYQTTNDRGFHRCLAGLLKLRAEKRKAEIGFESQQRKQQEEARKQAAEKRRQELHPWRVLNAEASTEHRFMKNSEYDQSAISVDGRMRRILATESAAHAARDAA